MKVVVTGGAGFIGGNLCRALVCERGVEQVVVVDDLSTGSRENVSHLPGVDLVEGSILDDSLLDKAFHGADCVVHLAARSSVPRSLEDPVASHHVNATGTILVLEAARRAAEPYVIVASSSSVYGANPALPKREDMATLPISPYGASKLATEAYALGYAHSFGLRVLALRLFNVFGPLQPAGHSYAAVVPTFVATALRGDPLPVHGDGHQTRDFTYVGTVTALLVDALRRKVTDPEPVNLAFGTRTSIVELIAQLELLLGIPLLRRHSGARPGDVRDSRADSSRLAHLFPEVKPVQLDDGLRETIEWHQTHVAPNVHQHVRS